MTWLVRLYPKRWRARYGRELEQLIRDLSPSRSRLAVSVDLVKGALSAHLHQEITMTEVTRRVTVRVGAIVAIVWILLSIEIWLTNVVFPSPTDDDAIPVVLSYLGVFATLFLIGFIARRAGAGRKGQTFAGILAGVAIGLLTAASFAIVDNVWLDIVAQQPNKIEGFAHSTAPSMRDFINGTLVGVAIFWPSAFGVIGGVLASVGGLLGDDPTTPGRDLPRLR